MKKLLLIFSSFLTLSASAQNDMESWQNYQVGLLPPMQLERPLGWHGADSLTCSFGPLLFPGTSFPKQVFKSTDKHSGNYAAMLLSADMDTLGVMPGMLTNAVISIDLSSEEIMFEGGEPVTARIQYVNAWVKYVPRNGDSASVIAQSIKTGAGAGGTDSTLGFGAAIISATSNYTLVTVPITYMDMVTVPDRIQVTFTSSAEEGQDSSMLYVDDVTYTFFPGNVAGVSNTEAVRCYPNPTTGGIYMTAPDASVYTWSAFSANGQLVGTKDFSKMGYADMSFLPNGMYFYNITNKEGLEVRTGKFIINK